MNQSPELVIEIGNSVRSFFPGEIIFGRVVTTHYSPVYLNDISITFEGTATVNWTERVSVVAAVDTQQRQTVHNISNETYFSSKTLLFGNGSGSLTPIGRGKNSYPFQFTLPANLPSSFNSTTGTVYYQIKAEIKLPGQKVDLMAITPFTVNGILDLNTEPSVTEPIFILKNKEIGYCCWADTVGLKINMERRGFVPGEVARFNLEVINPGKKKVTNIEVSLVQVSSFIAVGGAQKDISNIIYKASCPNDQGKCDSSWSGNILKIPSVAPTRLAGNCRIIDVQYLLQFDMNVQGRSRSIRTTTPIIIGTIPLRKTFGDVLTPGVNFVEPVPTPGPSNAHLPSAPVFELYPDLPPPTYAEAIKIDNVDMNSVHFKNEQKTSTDTAARVGESGKVNMAYQPGRPDTGTVQSAESGYLPNYITYGFNNSN